MLVLSRKRLKISDLAHWLAAAVQSFGQESFPALLEDAENWTWNLVYSKMFLRMRRMPFLRQHWRGSIAVEKINFPSVPVLITLIIITHAHTYTWCNFQNLHMECKCAFNAPCHASSWKCFDMLWENWLQRNTSEQCSSNSDSTEGIKSVADHGLSNFRSILYNAQIWCSSHLSQSTLKNSCRAPEVLCPVQVNW